MKVTQEKPKIFYRPVTITLETKEEADVLWHILNCSGRKSFEDYCKEEDIPANVDSIHSTLWQKLNACAGVRI